MFKALKILLIIFSSMSTAAAALPADFPTELLFAGKPVDSLCFYESEDTNFKVDLHQCGINAEKGRKITGSSEDLLRDGFTGYEFEWHLENSDITERGYSYYKVVARTPDSIIVYSINNGGGSGSFSSLSFVKRTGDQLAINSFINGDRCNGGIYDVHRERQSLIYAVNITPFDFLALAHDNSHHFKPYYDLDACAACCEATAVYALPLNTSQPQDHLEYVDLSPYPSDATQVSDKKIQACFDKMIEHDKQRNLLHLNPAALKAFGEQFNQLCY